MDVIGPDGRPTETGTSGKLTNGNATSAEDCSTVVAVASGAGRRKKAKRKNKAKNSSTEPEMTGEANATISSATLDTTRAQPLEAVLAKQVQQRNAAVVNSNCSSHSSNNHSSSHSNGLPAEESPSAVDAISKKLEQCVQIGLNGLTNGLPSARSEEANGGVTSLPPTHKDTPGRKKARSRATKKGHASTTDVGGDCAEHGNAKTDDKVEGKSQRPTAATALQDADRGQVKQPTDADVMVAVQQDTAEPEQASCVQATASCADPSTSADPLPAVDGSQPALTPMEIRYQVYESERQMPAIMALIQKDLSEPYSIYTYRYFIHNWPKLCFLALHRDTCVGAIVCKLDIHRQETRRGYIAMLAVDKDYRKLKIGTTLVQKAIQAMVEDHADEVVLETEITNQPALRLYENLGFVRDKRLFHYYLNGVDALRLKLWFR
uniref:N-terminal methionine N(alpha)-acetyltransferase NatC n=1 Tax=Anopheles quadriannulatus TaxID=34691 RepID=A0A182XGZ2_ANOQN